MREISIARKNDIEFFATSFEINESGMSAATPNYLDIGEVVELFPVVGDWVKAVVRRKVRAMYGFEFLGLTQLQKKQLKELCEGLPLFTSMATGA